MPMRWTISHDERLVMVTAEGPLTLLEIEAYFDAVVLAGAQPTPSCSTRATRRSAMPT